MKKVLPLYSLLSFLILSGCADSTLQVDNVENSIPTYNPIQPSQIVVNPVQWQVLNSASLASMCKKPDPNFIMYGVSPQGFQNNLLNLQDADRYIEQQNLNIEFYENYNKSLATLPPTQVTNNNN